MTKILRYPWDKWFGRKRFKLVRGKHFKCQMHSMAQQIRNAAAIRDVQVSLAIDEDQIIVTVVGRTI